MMQWHPVVKMVVQGSGGGWGFASLVAPLLRSGLGFVCRERRLTVNLILRTCRPPPLYIAQW